MSFVRWRVVPLLSVMVKSEYPEFIPLAEQDCLKNRLSVPPSLTLTLYIYIYIYTLTKRKKKQQVGSVIPQIFGLRLPQGLYSNKVQQNKVYIGAETLMLAKQVANVIYVANV